LGGVQVMTNRAAQGIAECERALALNRSQADAHATIGLAKYFNGHAEETEVHIQEALRISPRDTWAHVWMALVGAAKFALCMDDEAVAWLRRAIETNRNYPIAHLRLAATLAHLGRLSEARSAAQAGLALNAAYTIARERAAAPSDNPLYLSQRARVLEGMRKAGVPEG
jgi:tetratricopeptide (TPR) repeat protein